MSDYLYFPNNLKLKDSYSKLQKLFTIKSNSLQRKQELITSPFLLQQPFVCN